MPAAVGLALSLALGLAGCGPVPAPYRTDPMAKVENPLLSMPDRVGVTVAPPTGGPPALTGPLAERTAAALRRAGVPATTGPALTGGYLMEGLAGWADGQAVLSWQLGDRNGNGPGPIDVIAAAPRAAFEAGASELIERLADVSAARVSAALQSAPARAAATVASDVEAGGSGVHLLGVEAPGERLGSELTRALSALLDEVGAARAETAESAALLVQGAVDVSEGGKGGSTVAIDWWLMTGDGSVIGTLRQENAVPGDPRRQGFGAAAYDIALPVAEAVARSLGER